MAGRTHNQKRKTRIRKHLNDPMREERLGNAFMRMERMWRQLIPGIKILP